MDSNCQQGTMEAGGGSIMMRAVFTWHGLGPLVKVNKLLTRNSYVQLGDYF